MVQIMLRYHTKFALPEACTSRHGQASRRLPFLGGWPTPICHPTNGASSWPEMQRYLDAAHVPPRLCPPAPSFNLCFLLPQQSPRSPSPFPFLQPTLPARLSLGPLHLARVSRIAHIRRAASALLVERRVDAREQDRDGGSHMQHVE